MPLLVIFIIVPMAELAVLFKVGSTIGVLWTFALIFLTAFIGVNLLRRQGVSTLMRANERMQQGGLPAQELAEGFLLALAGALLLTPGFITDICGFTLLMPGVRGQVARSVMKRFAGKVVMGGQSPFDAAGPRPEHGTTQSKTQREQPRRNGDVIEGDYRRED